MSEEKGSEELRRLLSNEEEDERKKKKKRDPLDEYLEGNDGQGDPLDQFLRKESKPSTNAPTKEKRRSKKNSDDLLSNVPDELEGLIVSDVDSRPAPRPVLWGQNKEAENTQDLNLEFQSTEKEIFDNYEDVPMLKLDDLGAPSKKKDKKKEEADDGSDSSDSDE